ncbi:MAG TPA: glutaminyl-peptide cyclotransferase, partial [Gammaproteobacteria bacterium]
MEKKALINKLILLVAAYSFVLPAFASETDTVRHYSFKIVNTYPHDRTAFTQGLVYEEGYLY